jgi:S-adenosyl-L-methionine hydrolase (adenosine-forming)
MNKPIALLTDFGLQDQYVGSLKGVILGIHPKATVIDISHEIPPQNILAASFVLRAVYPYFPKGVIFVAVVDPGVGGKRKPVCIKHGHNYLIGPDNGIFSLALKGERVTARVIHNDRYFVKPVSSTFHGRDIFSPVAAHLSKKDIFKWLGPIVHSLNTLEVAEPKRTAKKVTGHVLYLDRFGNALTNILKSHCSQSIVKKPQKVLIQNRHKARYVRFFSQGKQSELIAVWNSGGQLEVAVREGSASQKYKLKIGDPVSIA